MARRRRGTGRRKAGGQMRAASSVVLVCLLLAGHAGSDPGEEDGAFRLTGGSVTLLGSLVSRDGASPDYPERYGRTLLNPSASLWSVPVSLEVLLSTMESENRQRISFFSLSARPSESGRGGLMSWIRRLGIGTNTVAFSPLIMDGRPVTGVELELSPGPVYAHFGGGRLRRSVNPADTSSYAYNRWVWGFRAGMGMPGSDHVHLIYLHGWDNTRLEGSGPWLDLPPAESHSAGLRGRLEAGRAVFSGEAAWSLYTADRTAPVKEYEDVPSWVEDLFGPNVTSRVAMALSGRALLRLGATSLQAGVSRVDPGYRSLGAPTLRPDLMEYEASASHRLAGRALTLTAFFRRGSDDLLQMKSARTVTSSAGARATWAPGGRSYVSVGASPWFRRADSLAGSDMDCWVASAAAGKSFGLYGLGLSTTGSFSLQRSAWRDDDRSYVGRTWAVTQSLEEGAGGLSTSGSLTLHQSRQPGLDENRWVWSVQGGYTDPGSWRAMSGVRMARAGGNRRKLTTWVGGSPPAIAGTATLGLRLSRTIYRSDGEEDYTELGARVSGSIIW